MVVALGGLLLVLAGIWWWHGRSGAPQAATAVAQAPKGVPVEVAEVKIHDLPVFLDGLGSVQAFNTVVVRSRVDGEIREIGFQEGQMVQKGDLIAQVDPRPYQASLDQAVAKKAQDEATLVSAKLDLARTSQLASRSFASQQQLDQQTANVGSLTAQVAFDQASIDNARTQLDYATIRAPLSGRTGLRLVDAGNIVRASDTTGIVEIAQVQPISVLFTAPEGQLHAIAEARAAGPVEVTALASDGKTVLDTGTLSLINNEVDPATGTVRLKATFGNARGRLWPGLSVSTRLKVRTLRGIPVVPDNAVQRGQNDLFVYVVGPDGKAQKRVTKMGAFSEGLVAIEDGLRPGERVVTAGQSRVTAGVALDLGGDPGRQASPSTTPTTAKAAGAAP